MELLDNQDYVLVNSAFPNVGKKLNLFWSHPEFVQLMFDLQHDSSDRPRMGFPAPVLFALQRLEEMHDQAFPHLKRKIPSTWGPVL